MTKMLAILLGFLILNACSGNNRKSIIPAGASLILDANDINASSSPAGTCSVLTWNDSSGLGNDASINCQLGGGFSGTGIPDDPKRITFNGITTFVSTTLNSGPSVMPDSTWIVWIKPASTGPSHILSTDDHAGSFNRSLIIDGTTADYGVFNPSTNSWLPTSADFGLWQFIAVIFTQDNLILYKNGTSFIFGNAPSYNATALPLTIGRSSGGSFDFFNGAMAWIAIYPRALSSTEIATTCRALLPRFNGAHCN